MPRVVIITGTLDNDALTTACGHFVDQRFSVVIIAPKSWAASGVFPPPTTLVLSGPSRDRLTDQRPDALAAVSWKLWTRYRDDPAAKRAVDQSDVIVALDETAIYTGWRIAKQFPTRVVSTSAATARGEFDAHAGAV